MRPTSLDRNVCRFKHDDAPVLPRRDSVAKTLVTEKRVLHTQAEGFVDRVAFVEHLGDREPASLQRAF